MRTITCSPTGELAAQEVDSGACQRSERRVEPDDTQKGQSGYSQDVFGVALFGSLPILQTVAA